LTQKINRIKSEASDSIGKLLGTELKLNIDNLKSFIDNSLIMWSNGNPLHYNALLEMDFMEAFRLSVYRDCRNVLTN